MKVNLGKFSLLFLAILVPISTLFWSCRPKTNKVSPFRWLVGTWEKNDSSFTSVENWEMVSSIEGDTVLIGLGYQVENGDTLFKEKLSIRCIKDSLYYVAMPEGSLPTLFLITKIENRSFTAENHNHDFPETIYYDSPGESTLKATVSGRIRAKVREINFAWKRKEIPS
jgi:hypothetical protein